MTITVAGTGLVVGVVMVQSGSEPGAHAGRLGLICCVSAVAGLRGMFRQAGAITAISITTAVLARSPDPGLAQAHSFYIFAGVLILMLPLILLVPEHRGRW